MDKENKSKYNGFITQKGNYIWAGALTLAWNQLIGNLVKEPIKLESGDSNSQKITENFNHTKFSVKDIDLNSIYIKSGYGQETVDEINTEIKKKFPKKSFGDLNLNLGEMELIVYAYLMKNIEFETPFKKSKKQTFEFNGKKVQSFYAENQEQKSQIRYAYYKNPNQFMVSINSKKEGDLIYFIKNKQIQDCDHAIQAVNFYEDKMISQIKNIDKFQMPCVDFNIQRQLRQLSGQKIKNQNLQGYTFEYVYQAIKLKIDEKGAKVENQAAISMFGSGMSENQPQPKYFLLNKQFWVVMKEEGKHPYFCALVKDPVDEE